MFTFLIQIFSHCLVLLQSNFKPFNGNFFTLNWSFSSALNTLWKLMLELSKQKCYKLLMVLHHNLTTIYCNRKGVCSKCQTLIMHYSSDTAEMFADKMLLYSVQCSFERISEMMLSKLWMSLCTIRTKLAEMLSTIYSHMPWLNGISSGSWTCELLTIYAKETPDQPE